MTFFFILIFHDYNDKYTILTKFVTMIKLVQIELEMVSFFFPKFIDTWLIILFFGPKMKIKL